MEFDKYIRYAMTFGRHTPTANKLVADHEVERFLHEDISPKFPGFTVTNHAGYWNGDSEPSFTVTIQVPATEYTGSKIAEICQAYNRLFSQDCVMVTRDVVEVAFEARR